MTTLQLHARRKDGGLVYRIWDSVLARYMTEAMSPQEFRETMRVFFVFLGVGIDEGKAEERHALIDIWLEQAQHGDSERPMMDRSIDPWKQEVNLPVAGTTWGSFVDQRRVQMLGELWLSLRRELFRRTVIAEAPIATRNLLECGIVINHLLDRGWVLTKVAYGERYNRKECGFTSATDYKRKVKSLQRAWRGLVKVEISDGGPGASIVVTFTAL